MIHLIHGHSQIPWATAPHATPTRFSGVNREFARGSNPSSAWVALIRLWTTRIGSTERKLRKLTQVRTRTVAERRRNELAKSVGDRKRMELRAAAVLEMSRKSGKKNKGMARIVRSHGLRSSPVRRRNAFHCL